MVVENGSMAYRRDGKVYQAGLFFGELEEAVKGDPQEEQAFRAVAPKLHKCQQGWQE